MGIEHSTNNIQANLKFDTANRSAKRIKANDLVYIGKH